MIAPSRGRSAYLARLHKLLIATAAITVLVPALRAQQAPEQQAGGSVPPARTQPAPKPRQQSDGERVFAENCSRCHAMPEGFSSRIAGTVERHMRIRASLSEQDVNALMRFFNPQ